MSHFYTAPLIRNFGLKNVKGKGCLLMLAMATLLNCMSYLPRGYPSCKCKGETTQLAHSTKGQGSSRSGSRGGLAVLSQVFSCSLLHQPGQICQWAPGIPELLMWDAPTALPPLTPYIANSPLPPCCYRSCSWLPQELLVVQKIQVCYVLACAWTFIPYTTKLQPLPGSGVDATWRNSMQNQSIRAANLKVRDKKTSFWKVS